ncbi:MAG: hypothetical protein Q8Q87_03665 [Candidatus Omnitrophota bacterium]|nr:hypothetical protein [Candidatus Omnitrophota bacterium]
MSIVQEALKKAQNYRQSDAEQSPSKKKFGPVVLLIVFIALLGVTIKQASFSSGKSDSRAGSALTEAIYKPISSLDMKSGDYPVAEPFTSSAPKPTAVSGKFPNFILNGIMELADGPRAIINNVIVATGDMIGGATVKKIDKDRVLLQKDDSVVTLGME